MNLLVVCLWLLALASPLVAEDRLTITRKGGFPTVRMKGTNSAPVATVINGPRFKALQKDIEEVIRLMGDKTEWWEVGPDAAYDSAEIHLGNKRYVVNSWHPVFRMNPRVAVSETQGLVPVSGVAEKQKIEKGNSGKYRTIVALFDKAQNALQGVPADGEPFRPETNQNSGAAGSHR